MNINLDEGKNGGQEEDEDNNGGQKDAVPSETLPRTTVKKLTESKLRSKEIKEIKSEIKMLWSVVQDKNGAEKEVIRENATLKSENFALKSNVVELKLIIESLKSQITVLEQEKDSISLAFKIVTKECGGSDPSAIRDCDTSVIITESKEPSSNDKKWQTVQKRKRRGKSKGYKADGQTVQTKNPTESHNERGYPFVKPACKSGNLFTY